MKVPGRAIWWSTVLLFLTFLISCRTSDDAVAAATQAATTAADLTSYYSAMSQIIAGDVALMQLDTTLRGVPFAAEDRTALSTTASELQKRAELASSLQALSTAFSNLTGSSAPTDVSNAASKLATELTTLKPVKLPSASPVSLPSAIGDASKFILSMVQQHQERKLAPALDKTFAALKETFTAENDVYDSLNKTYLALAGALAKVCIEKNLVDNTSLLSPALQPFSLAARGSTDADALLRDAAKAQIDQASHNLTDAHAKASAAMLQAITEMGTRIHTLATGAPMTSRGAPVTLTTVEGWINTASSYLSAGSTAATSTSSAAPAPAAAKSTKK
jgi:hypothetical protein